MVPDPPAAGGGLGGPSPPTLRLSGWRPGGPPAPPGGGGGGARGSLIPRTPPSALGVGGVPDPPFPLGLSKMACSIDALIHSVETVPLYLRQDLLNRVRSHGLHLVVDYAMLDDSDIDEVISGNPDLMPLATEVWVRSRSYVDGWAKGQALQTRAAVRAPCPRPPQPDPPPCSRPSSSSSAAAAVRAVRTYTMRLLSKRAAPAPRKHMKKTRLEIIEKEAMSKAKEKIHGIFAREAGDTPRFQRLLGASPLMQDLQLDVYRLSSKSHRVVASRASLVSSFFKDLKTLGWSVKDMDKFMVAAWVRGKVKDAAKSASRAVRTTLMLVEAATDVPTFLKDPIVQGQLTLGNNEVSHSEPAVQAANIDVETVIMFEDLVWTAETAVQRCLAGCMALLAGSSLRASDSIRTRSLDVRGDAITGVSRMKAKKVWSRWYACRTGFSGKEWARQWLLELKSCDLPGSDFLVWAPNSTLDAWLERPAEYADLRRALHFMLIVYKGYPASTAATYNPHSFKHVLVTAAQQLRTFGVVTEDDIERLGHWSKGSSMPRNYDSAAGVSELVTRTKVINQLRAGWRPVAEGDLPRAPLAAQDVGRGSAGTMVDPIRVGHAKRKMAHLWIGGRKTMCGWWTCGSVDDPVDGAIFGEVPDLFTRCRQCG